jgi:hypothetical protein
VGKRINKNNPTSAVAWLALGCFALPAFAQISVDGVLDEPQWQQALRIDQFVTTEPLTGEPAKYHTEVLLLTNDEGIFVGFRNYQPPGVKRVQRHFARDSSIEADRNILGIDFDGSGLSGYDFTVGASNSQQDGIFGDDNTWSGDWDGNWHSQTSQDEEYWYTEIHIPWTVAPMSQARNGEKTMAFYFGRVVYDESLRFAYPDASYQRPTFLSDWKPTPVSQVKTSTLDWFPYAAALEDRQQDDSELKVGLDVVWRPDSSTQLTGSINPDFAQVESDDLVVNFSAIETFFTEQRPFFTENQALFTRQVPVGDLLLYTRRIGAQADSGEQRLTDINLAGKYTHYGDSLDYGLFAVTEDNTGQADGGDYLSTRVQGLALPGLTLGHSLTWADRPTLDRQAMVNAVDFDWQASQGMRIRGQYLHSDIDQDANGFNDNQKLNEDDGAGWLEWRYAPNDEWQYRLNFTAYGDDFEMNDMGFLQRNDWRELFGRIRHDINSYPDDSRLRSSWWEYNAGYQENTDGDRQPTWVEIQRYLVFRSTRELGLEAGYQMSSHDDLITRGNGQLKMEEQQWYELTYLNSRGGRFSFSLEYEAATSGTDEFSHRLDFSPQFYASQGLTLSADLGYQHYREWLLWDFRSEQLATFESDVYQADLKLDWYPGSRQEVRLKLQWTSVKSDAVEGYDLSGSGRLRPSGRPVSDFSVSDTALQLRYRYELAPLSEIYLVYTRGGYWEADDNRDSPLDLWQNAWDDKTAERIVAKIRYRF